jgi:hypothetical protein
MTIERRLDPLQPPPLLSLEALRSRGHPASWPPPPSAASRSATCASSVDQSGVQRGKLLERPTPPPKRAAASRARSSSRRRCARDRRTCSAAAYHSVGFRSSNDRGRDAVGCFAARRARSASFLGSTGSPRRRVEERDSRRSVTAVSAARGPSRPRRPSIERQRPLVLRAALGARHRARGRGPAAVEPVHRMFERGPGDARRHHLGPLGPCARRTNVRAGATADREVDAGGALRPVQRRPRARVPGRSAPRSAAG